MTESNGKVSGTEVILSEDIVLWVKKSIIQKYF